MNLIEEIDKLNVSKKLQLIDYMFASIKGSVLSCNDEPLLYQEVEKRWNTTKEEDYIPYQRIKKEFGFE